MSAQSLANLYCPNGLTINGPSISVPGQYVKLNVTTTSSSANINFGTLPTTIPWILSSGNVNLLQLAKGSYIVSLFCPSALAAAGPSGSYGTMGISQNGVNLISDTRNMYGLTSGTSTYMSLALPVNSDGTASNALSGYVTLSGVSFSTSTQTHVLTIVKVA